MKDYKAPLMDINFVQNELHDFDSHYQSLKGGEELNRELRSAIVEEAARFCEQELAPLRLSGDEEGCHWTEEGVTTPKGFVKAYQKYVEGGWPGLCMPEKYGGQGLLPSMNLVVSEITGQANHAWSMYPGLSAGCRETLLQHASEQQKQLYLPKLVEGSWMGTMCLTEPQCGSDLSFLRTKAEDNGDGTYCLNGTKIFISSGEHDMSENIIHIVLARLPDAPPGTKGISLFLVPKFLVDEQGNLTKRNGVQCGSIEHKMGINANATCVLNFDNAVGYLVGEEHKGLNHMFVFMNVARVGTAIQGLNHAEIALQGALAYALEREAGRSVTGVKAPNRPADTLIVHPDVKRMILTIKAFAEGCRAFIYMLAKKSDIIAVGSEEEIKEADNLLAFLTPIAKGFITEVGLESASVGLQVFGGHGYIRETGIEQNFRDARIATLYEGTTGIQALDLIGRKVMRDGGKIFAQVLGLINVDAEKMDDEFKAPLMEKTAEWVLITKQLGDKVQNDLDEMGAASVDYLMYAGYVILAWQWGNMGTLAQKKVGEGLFYKSKLKTARFYFKRILPRTLTHKALIEEGVESINGLTNEEYQQLSELG